MRKIRFRAKRQDTGEWVKSSVMVPICDENDGRVKIFMPDSPSPAHAYADREGDIVQLDARLYRVQEDTIGQFTGEQDLNDRDIYEGDIVKHNDKLFVIRYFDRYSRFAGKRKGAIFTIFVFANSEVVGNIYDNPELMEGRL